MVFELEQAVHRALRKRSRTRRQRLSDWFLDTAIGNVCSALGICAIIIGIPILALIIFIPDEEPSGNDSNHYNRDFKTFCSQLDGRTIIDDRDLCLAKNNKILMWESDPKDVPGWKHYNDDFARYCQARGGSATVGIAHDVCVKNGILIMREGQYND